MSLENNYTPQKIENTTPVETQVPVLERILGLTDAKIETLSLVNLVECLEVMREDGNHFIQDTFERKTLHPVFIKILHAINQKTKQMLDENS